MNSKAPIFNFNYLKENMKKSRGVIYLFILVIPIFTYLFMLLLNKAHTGMTYFPSLADLAIPSIIGMYIVPVVMAVTLFNFLFKKDSVDFINALPMKRRTVYITNIIGGIGLFFIIFLITSIVMLVSANFLSNLVIPSMMYFHYFITFFITYSFTFIVSSLALSLTGNRMTHIALTLILLFIPGFVVDFYNSRVYDNAEIGYAYPSCDQYDTRCDSNQIYNDLVIEKSYKLENGQTLPYKYINTVPRAIFEMNRNEITYQNELASVYNLSSLLRMIILSVIYFAIGLYAFVKRRMEIAESTFKSENIHQLVKCITLFPPCLVAITIFKEDTSITTFMIILAVIITIYAIYDLITRRNSGKFIKSAIYFLGLALVSIIVYVGLDQIANLQPSKTVKREDVSNIGIVPNNYIGNYESNMDMTLLKFKLGDSNIIDLIFNNANKKVSGSEKNKIFTIRLGLKNGATYYFDMILSTEEFDKLLKLLDENDKYTNALKAIPYNQVYGIKMGNSYLDKEDIKDVKELIKEGYENKSVSDIVKADYVDPKDMYNVGYNLMNTLYTYDSGVNTYLVSTMINSKMINYVMQTNNALYIKNIKDKNININELYFNLNSNGIAENDSGYFEYGYVDNAESVKLIYRYINDNVKSDTDFSKYAISDIIIFNVYREAIDYRVFLPKSKSFEELYNQVKKNTDEAIDADKAKL